MPEHRAGLRLMAVAAGVDDHVPGDPRGDGGAVPAGDQMQGQVDAAGDAGRGDHAVVGGEQDVADDERAGVAYGQFVLHVVMGGAAPPLEQPGPPERLRPRADAGHRPAHGVMVPQDLEGGLADGGRVGQGDGTPAGHHDQVLGSEVGPVGAGHQRQPLGAGDLGLLGDVGEGVRVPEIGGCGEDLRGAGQVQQMDSGHQEEDDVAHDSVIMPEGRPRLPVRRPWRWWRTVRRGRIRYGG